MIRNIPNAITLANLLCGCIGILLVFEGNEKGASWLIVLAAVFDFLDGFAAKLLKAQSPIGKDLDSLADVVTFGVLPSFILFFMMKKEFLESDMAFLSYSAFLVAAFSALRLAKFNNDPRQGDAFIGIPTPANALLVASLPFVMDHSDLPAAGWLLLGYTLIMSYLLIAEIHLLALKFKGFGWEGNQVRYVLIVVSLILLVLFGWVGVPLVMLAYLVFSFYSRRTI